MSVKYYSKLFPAYLKTNDFNIFAVDWSPLNQSPCYPAAVWNARHVGTCTAQLVDRIRDMGAVDIHVIGFSLGRKLLQCSTNFWKIGFDSGAHITNFISLALLPYRLPRITGLDPALPGYLFANNDEKLDRSDAEFVDVYHTSAFMQGKAQESGHIDFYFNGGSVQPGCWQEESKLVLFALPFNINFCICRFLVMQSPSSSNILCGIHQFPGRVLGIQMSQLFRLFETQLRSERDRSSFRRKSEQIHSGNIHGATVLTQIATK